MELIIQTNPAKEATIEIAGDEHFDMPPGKFLKIETSPDGGEILNIECPDDKKWVVIVSVRIIESDL